MGKQSLKKTEARQIDYGIILSVFILFIISLIAIYATTVLIGQGSLKTTVLHVGWYALGCVAVALMMQFDSKQLWKLAPWAYALALILLVAVLFFYDRQTAASFGAKSWFRFGSIGFQPAEVSKIALIVMLAKVVTQHNVKTKQHTLTSDWRLLGKIIAYALPVLLLVILENDLGTTLVVLAIVLGVILLSGITPKILIPLFLSGILIASIVLYLAIYHRDILAFFGFKSYQFGRIDSWLDPFAYGSKESYQVKNAMLAISSGELAGKGIGVSEVFIPIRESDMIFSTIGENTGFLGSFFVIFVYFTLIYQMIIICFDTKNEFYTYIAVGVISMIVFHVFENIGMNIGLLPLTGIPLPFISQGGTALLGNMLGIGLMMSMRYHYTSYSTLYGTRH